MAKTCECGCGREMSSASRWRYIRGHKPNAGSTGRPVGDGQRRAPKSGAVLRVVSYESTLAMVEENLAAVKARRREIEEEISTLNEELAQMHRQLSAVAKDEYELEALRTALAPFCEAMQIEISATVTTVGGTE